MQESNGSAIAEATPTPIEVNIKNNANTEKMLDETSTPEAPKFKTVKLNRAERRTIDKIFRSKTFNFRQYETFIKRGMSHLDALHFVSDQNKYSTFFFNLFKKAK